MNALLAVIPDDRWVTSIEAADLAQGHGLPVTQTAHGPQLGEVPVSSVLNGLRRRGHVVSWRAARGRIWTRTPSGTEALERTPA